MADHPDTSPPGTPPEPTYEPGPASAAGMTPGGKVRRTRVSAWWVGLIVAAVVLVLLLTFIAQNSRDVTVHFLGLRGEVSLAVALLFSAVGGALLIAIPGTARIWQLRRALKHNAGHPAR